MNPIFFRLAAFHDVGVEYTSKGVELGLFGGRLPSGSMSNLKHNIELTAHRFGTECIHGERSRFHLNAVLLGSETAPTPQVQPREGFTRADPLMLYALANIKPWAIDFLHLDFVLNLQLSTSYLIPTGSHDISQCYGLESRS